MDIEKLATESFAVVVALMLLRFFLRDLTKKLDCIKDSLIEITRRIKNMEDKRKE